MGLVGCSTLSQTVETPVVMEKGKYAIGAGAGYAHNINRNGVDPDQAEEFVPAMFAGGRYSPASNIEFAAAGGTLGLNNGSGIDLRFRYQWLGQWVDPHADDDDDDDSDFSEADLDKKPYVRNGLVSTMSLGIFWSGFNLLDSDSASQYDSGIYFSNSFGIKRKSWVYYFGPKVMLLETQYRYKENRLLPNYDVDSIYNEVTFGVFAGITYTRTSKKRHRYIIDMMLSVMQLPTNAEDRSNGLFPALVISAWYVD